MKSVREEVLSIAAVLSVPLVFAAAFPRAAVGFSASDAVGRAWDQKLDIVFLDSDAVAKAMRTTRILSMRGGNGGTVVEDLLSVELPGASSAPLMPIGFRDRHRGPAVVESGISPFLPSRRAGAPVRIPAGKDADALPFPRNELLDLN